MIDSQDEYEDLDDRKKRDETDRKRKRDKELGDIRALLKLPEGRRFFWRLLGHTRVNASIWDGSARIHYNSGRQDVGHFILAEICTAREEAYLQMMKENRGNQDV